MSLMSKTVHLYYSNWGCFLQNCADYDYSRFVQLFYKTIEVLWCWPRGAGVHWSRGSNHHSACWNSSASPETKNKRHCLKHWQIRRIILKGCDKTLRKDKNNKRIFIFCLQHLCCDGRPLGKVPGWPDCPWLLCLAGLAQLPDQPWRVEDLGEDSSSITILSPMTGQADCSAVKNEQASITAALAKRTNSSLCQCWKQPLSMETWGGINDGSICLWEHGWVSTPFICFLVLYMS